MIYHSYYTIHLQIIIINLLGSSLYKHLMLRFCLWLEGSMPIRYVNFLDYCSEIRILEKDGGRWRFRHQILADYFRGGVNDDFFNASTDEEVKA